MRNTLYHAGVLRILQKSHWWLSKDDVRAVLCRNCPSQAMYINIPTPAAHSLLYSPTLLFYFYQKNQFKENPWLFLTSRRSSAWETWDFSSINSNCKASAPWFASKFPHFYNNIDVSNVWCWISRYPKPARRFIWREGREVFPQNDLKTYASISHGAEFCPTGGNLSINSSPLALLRPIFSLCCPPFL